MIELKTLEAYCNELLSADAFDDYCPNGVQVEAGIEVRRIVSGVTACQALIDAAVEASADLLLVHHGYFWKGEPLPLTGIRACRVGTLFRQGLSLLAYHLPLDVHPELGNNRLLGQRLGFADARPLCEARGLVWGVELHQPIAANELSARIEKGLERTPLHVPAAATALRRIGWCTGAAQGHIKEAAALGLDAFISGEISESTVHLARELGVHYFAAGHHATERFGVQALGEHLACRFGLEHRFIEVPNPV